jgi:hypothetical protein
MDLFKAIQDLYEEKRRLDQVIASLEALQALDEGRSREGAPKKRGRKSMSVDERKEVSERMRQYWESRRKTSNRPKHSPSGE